MKEASRSFLFCLKVRVVCVLIDVEEYAGIRLSMPKDWVSNVPCSMRVQIILHWLLKACDKI